jgi:hypothetical protein
MTQSKPKVTLALNAYCVTRQTKTSWVALHIDPNRKPVELNGSVSSYSLAKAHLTALITALQDLAHPCDITVACTDKSVLRAILGLHSYAEADWNRSDGSPMAYAKLLEAVYWLTKDGKHSIECVNDASQSPEREWCAQALRLAKAV